MRVVLCQKQIASDGRGGGLGTLYANTAKALTGAGAQVTVVTATEPAGVGVDGVSIVSVRDAEADPAAYAVQVRAALEGLDFDIAECASWKAELAAYAALPAGARRPVVVRGELPAVVLDPEAPGIEQERALMQHADAVLPVSQTVADLIRLHYEREPDEVIYNAVDTEVFAPAPTVRAERVADGRSPQRRVLWVGSHAPIKRLDMLDAMIRGTPAHITFDIVLPWAEGNAHITRLSAHARVTLHHHVTQRRMAELYTEADVLLSTSRLEAFGLGILEAMACGTPVLIPRDIGGATEFVREGQDGHYYDTVEEAIARLEREDWGRFGAAMIEHARTFSWARCAEQTLAAYARVLARRRSGGA